MAQYSITKLLKENGIKQYGDVWENQLEKEFTDRYDKFVGLMEDLESGKEGITSEMLNTESDELVEIFNELHDIEIEEPEEKTTEETTEKIEKTEDSEQKTPPENLEVKTTEKIEKNENKKPDSTEQNNSETENPGNKKPKDIQQSSYTETNPAIVQSTKKEEETPDESKTDTNINTDHKQSDKPIDQNKETMEQPEEKVEKTEQPEEKQEVVQDVQENIPVNTDVDTKIAEFIQNNPESRITLKQLSIITENIDICMKSGSPVEFTAGRYKFIPISSEIFAQGAFNIWKITIS